MAIQYLFPFEFMFCQFLEWLMNYQFPFWIQKFKHPLIMRKCSFKNETKKKKVEVWLLAIWLYMYQWIKTNICKYIYLCLQYCVFNFSIFHSIYNLLYVIPFILKWPYNIYSHSNLCSINFWKWTINSLFEFENLNTH